MSIELHKVSVDHNRPSSHKHTTQHKQAEVIKVSLHNHFSQLWTEVLQLLLAFSLRDTLMDILHLVLPETSVLRALMVIQCLIHILDLQIQRTIKHLDDSPLLMALPQLMMVANTVDRLDSLVNRMVGSELSRACLWELVKNGFLLEHTHVFDPFLWQIISKSITLASGFDILFHIQMVSYDRHTPTGLEARYIFLL